jgi:hypothetical protein
MLTHADGEGRRASAASMSMSAVQGGVVFTGSGSWGGGGGALGGDAGGEGARVDKRGLMQVVVELLVTWHQPYADVC